MANHVEVLRVLRDFYSGSVLDHSEKAAALTHAIATCEQHAALVARLGELVDLWRDPSWLPANKFAAGFALKCADDLARVVADTTKDTTGEKSD